MGDASPSQVEQLRAIASMKARCWLAPRPGSNFLPLLRLETGASDVMGEDLQALFELGLLVAHPLPADAPIIAGGWGGERYGEVPDIDCDFRWELSERGAHLADAASLDQARLMNTTD
jgi:hypothetical protein